MTRKNSNLLKGETFGRQLSHHTLDPTYGGQGGWAPDLTQWQNNQAYVSRQIIGVLIERPAFFDLMPNADKLTQILRAFVETHVLTIEGLTSGLSVDFEGHPVGGAGEQQEEPTNATRARSEPVITAMDLAGLPFQNFFRVWIQYGIMDPDTKYALASALPNSPTDQPWTPQMYTATMLFFEPDATHTYVNRAWLCTNMAPRNNGDETGRRDLSAAGEMLRLSIPFTSLTQVGVGVNAFAQDILNKMRKTNANPYLRASFVGKIDSDVTTNEEPSYAKTIRDTADAAITTPQNP